MLNRSQIMTMIMMRNRENTLFFSEYIPSDITNYMIRISDLAYDPKSDIAIALRLAADGTRKALDALTAMLDKDDRLILQAGNVRTRGGNDLDRVTLYEFFLRTFDPDAAKLIEPYFAKITDENGQPVNGEIERMRQYNRYRPYIKALAKQFASKKPAYDLRPLIKLIQQSSPEDITAALNHDMKHESKLREALYDFQTAVRYPIGMMDYEHYTTLQQAFDLLFNKKNWKKLSNNDEYLDKCFLIWRQIIGYLQVGLPAVDRFAFARSFDDEERTVDLKYTYGTFPDAPLDEEFSDLVGFDPDTSSDEESSNLPELGFNIAIFGHYRGGMSLSPKEAAVFKNHLANKIFKLIELEHPHSQPKERCTIS